MLLPLDPNGATKLRDYVGGEDGRDDTLAAATYLQALGLVNDYIRSVDAAGLEPGDVAAIEGTVYEVGSKLWLRRNAPNGTPTYEFGDAPSGAALAPVDPMITAYPILDRYTAGGFA